jgi:hypothetical protein
MAKQDETPLKSSENVYVRFQRPAEKHTRLVKILHNRRATGEHALRLIDLYDEAVDLGTEALEKMFLSHVG